MTPYYELPEWAGWLASIRGQPDDDHRRLFCADWLDELETDEASQRAELIRVQVAAWRHPSRLLNPDATYGEYADLKRREFDIITYFGRTWIGWDAFRVMPAPLLAPLPLGKDEVEFSRGFISRVEAPLGVLHGGECGRCADRRRNEGYVSRYRTFTDCQQCRGTGRATGVLGELLRREPITAAGIDVADKEPQEDDVSDLPFGWRRGGTMSARHCLPSAVWDELHGFKPTGWKERGGYGWFCSFPTTDAARLALGSALIRIHSPKSEVTT